MRLSDEPKQDRNRSTPPPNPAQDHQGPETGTPTAPQTSGCSHSLSIAEVRQTKRSGRGVRRIVTLCGTITQLVAENDRHLLASESDTNSDGGDYDGDGLNGVLSPERKEEIRR